VKQEEGPLALTEITSSSEYKLESEDSMTSSLLSLYTLLPLTPLPLSLSISPSSFYNISQYSSINYKQIIQQQQEQLATLQTQLQILQARESEGGASIEVVRPQIFDRALSKVAGFITVCRLYKNEDAEGNSRKAHLMGVIICTRRIGRCLKGKYIGESGGRSIEI